ncbi:unnamed protein product [Staurois parvus]|uniref:Uncharacterized protein n=1 Tax=Staurois parvus TaxID=386267 RepID=A0ABN9AQ53_9NEOB|nr:unnamed protein product [Staurois parvus]
MLLSIMFNILPDHGEGWCDHLVWDPENIEDLGISLVGSHYWIHLPDDGEGWWDLPVWNPGNTEDGDISLVGSHDWIHLNVAHISTLKIKYNSKNAITVQSIM